MSERSKRSAHVPNMTRRFPRDFGDLQLEGISIENVRAYRDEQYFPLSPVTLIFGANSSGKTTLFNAIALLRQSRGQFGMRGRGRLAVRGSDVDFGIASEVPNRDNPLGESAIRLFARPRELSGGVGPALYSTAAMEYIVEAQQPRFGVGVKFKLVRPAHSFPYLEIFGYELFLGYDPRPLMVFTRNETSGDEEISRLTYSVSECNDHHPFWKWFIRNYGARLLMHGASAALGSDPDEPDRVSPRIDESISERSALGEYFANLYKDLSEKNKWTESVDDETGEVRLSNPLQEELFTLRNGTDRASRRETPIVRDVLRKHPVSDDVHGQLLALLFQEVRRGEIAGSLHGWAPVGPNPAIARLRMLRSLANQKNEEKVQLSSRESERSLFQRGLFIGNDIPSVFPQEFLITAASSISTLIDNMETISARRGEFRRTFILGESEQPGELDVATASKDQIERMNQALKAAKVPFSYAVRVFTPDTQGIAELRIGAVEVFDHTGRQKNIADVGTGTQYLLPVALAISAESRGLLAIQEPESHLHPVLQAAVATLIASNASESNHPILIETHSEAILRRIVDHISGDALPRISSAMVSLLYVNRSGESSSVRSIRIADDGRLLDGWPEAAADEGFDL